MKRQRLTELVMAAMIAALTAVLSQISIPFYPVPFSCGMIGVFAAGVLLRPRYAFMSLIVYLLLGICGLPVFSGLKSGLGTVVGPTGGFLFAYPLVALTISALSFNRKSLMCFASILISLIVLYACGTLWLCYVSKIDFWKGLESAVFPYVFVDCVKIVVSVPLLQTVKRHMRTLIPALREMENN